MLIAPVLADPHLLGLINRDFERQEPGYKHKSLSNAARQFVKKHNWPGNVRQLYNTLLRAAILTDGDVLDRNDVARAVDELPGRVRR